ncbi:MAG: hypothetical protein A2W69_03825 [Gammaproteobacteria bacterium RIFCSPLOWO2_02_47_7]|nr:MAG: hypothetical protein A2W69_03825 [Gammaproteobacteria bacterium RIFCSPLOWO2_02_47_7]
MLPLAVERSIAIIIDRLFLRDKLFHKYYSLPPPVPHLFTKIVFLSSLTKLIIAPANLAVTGWGRLDNHVVCDPGFNPQQCPEYHVNVSSNARKPRYAPTGDFICD